MFVTLIGSVRWWKPFPALSKTPSMRVFKLSSLSIKIGKTSSIDTATVDVNGAFSARETTKTLLSYLVVDDNHPLTRIRHPRKCCLNRREVASAQFN